MPYVAYVGTSLRSLSVGALPSSAAAGTIDLPGVTDYQQLRIELQSVKDDGGAQVPRSQRARELEPLDRAAAFYAAHLRAPKSANARQAAEYVISRGLGPAICEKFGVGFAPGDGTALLRAARGGFRPRRCVAPDRHRSGGAAATGRS